MKKKIIGILAVSSLVTSLGFAAPLNDYSQGKVAVDVSARPSGDFKVSGSALDGTYDGRTNWEYGLTVGLGNNFAFEYKNFNPKSKDYHYDLSGFPSTMNGKLDTQEFNILYKVDNNFTVFTGVNTVKSKYSLFGVDFDGNNKTNWQLGVTGQTPIGKNLTGYATVAAGQDSSSWRIGAAYAIDKNLDFNVFYAQNKYDDVKYDSTLASAVGRDADYKIKGMGYGLTYKF